MFNVRDLHAGLRMLGSSPIMIGATLSLALALGTSGAAFSMARGVVLDPLPWNDAERVVALLDRDRHGQVEVPYGRALDWETESESFEVFSMSRFWGAIIRSKDRAPHPVAIVSTAPEMLARLGVDVLLGRALAAADEQPEGARAVLLTYDFWQSHFDADPSIVGQSARIGEEDVTVVGVVDRGEWFPVMGLDLVTILRDGELPVTRDTPQVRVLGLLSPGVTLKAAQAEMDALSARLAQEYPDTDDARDIEVHRADNDVFGAQASTAAKLLMAAVACVLLVASVNVGTLLLARRHDLAVASAVSSRGELLVRLVREGAVLGLVALAGAGVVTYVILEAILAIFPSHIPYAYQIFRFDAAVIGFLTASTLLSLLVFVVVAALHGGPRADRRNAGSEADVRTHRTRGSAILLSGLAILQIAAAIALVPNAILTARTFDSLLDVDTGYDRDNLMYVAVKLPDARYPSPAEYADFASALTSNLARIPDVLEAAVISTSLESPQGPERWVEISRRDAVEPIASAGIRWAAVSEGLVPALGLRVVRGRNLEGRDDRGAPLVAMLNEAAATQLLSGNDPLGASISFEDGRPREIVGIVQSVRRVAVDAVEQPEVWVPFAQEPERNFRLVARTRTEPLSLETDVRAAFAQTDRLLPVALVTSANQHLSDALTPVKMFAGLLSLLALLALTLEIVGVYAVVGYIAGRPRSPGSPDRALRRTAAVVPTGLVLGVLLSLALSAALRATGLVQGSLWDPAAMASVIGVAAIGLAASALAAKRIARTAYTSPSLDGLAG